MPIKLDRREALSLAPVKPLGVFRRRFFATSVDLKDSATTCRRIRLDTIGDRVPYMIHSRAGFLSALTVYWYKLVAGFHALLRLI